MRPEVGANLRDGFMYDGYDPIPPLSAIPFGYEVKPEPVRPHSERPGDAAALRRLMFPSQQSDVESGLEYFGATYFSAAQGRLTSPDLPLLDQNVFDPKAGTCTQGGGVGVYANVSTHRGCKKRR
jgi:hypothetical protein